MKKCHTKYSEQFYKASNGHLDLHTKLFGAILNCDYIVFAMLDLRNSILPRRHRDP